MRRLTDASNPTCARSFALPFSPPSPLSVRHARKVVLRLISRRRKRLRNQNRATGDAPTSPFAVPKDKHASRPKEFARTYTTAPRRLHDIAQAPPELASFTRKSSAKTQGKPDMKEKRASTVLSPAQQLQMAAARGGCGETVSGDEGCAAGGGRAGEEAGEE
ncbi:hypothetical protein MSAN_02533100 [Mycena sanguinolenta]|uniref:Uncharacterized protein n=1 Tax=Mycena sanguinolenta TaxID=230812 RepID=A0A8H6WMM3_9AGAR|nr:hypothetical protein MSAN_02533100 [Mycena sanguinolenta]